MPPDMLATVGGLLAVVVPEGPLQVAGVLHCVVVLVVPLHVVVLVPVVPPPLIRLIAVLRVRVGINDAVVAGVGELVSGQLPEHAPVPGHPLHPSFSWTCRC